MVPPYPRGWIIYAGWKAYIPNLSFLFCTKLVGGGWWWWLDFIDQIEFFIGLDKAEHSLIGFKVDKNIH